MDCVYVVVGCVVWACVECAYMGVLVVWCGVCVECGYVGAGCVVWECGLVCVGRVCVVWGCGLVCVCTCKVYPGVRNVVKNKCSLRQRGKSTREIQ